MLKEPSIKARISQVRNTLGKVYHLCLMKDFKSLEAGECIIPVFKLKNKYIRDAEFAIATAWPTAYDVNSLEQIKGRKIYFVQDYEPYFYMFGEALYKIMKCGIRKQQQKKPMICHYLK